MIVSDNDEMNEFFENTKKLKIEACIFQAGNDISLKDIQRNIPSLSIPELRDVIDELKNDYQSNSSGLRLKYFTKDTVGFTIEESLFREPIIESFTRGKDLSPSELKTLAFVGYFQPVEDREVIELVGRGSKKALKSLEKRTFIKKEKQSYEILDENGDSNEIRVNVYATTPQLALYLGVENNPEVIKNWIEKFM